jgi:hypothetical protein
VFVHFISQTNLQDNWKRKSTTIDVTPRPASVRAHPVTIYVMEEAASIRAPPVEVMFTHREEFMNIFNTVTTPNLKLKAVGSGKTINMTDR